MIRGREGNVPQPDELNAFLGKNREEAAGNISGTGIVAGGDSLCGGQGENGAVRCGLQCCQFGIEQGYQRENTLLSVNSGTFSIPIVLSDVTARKTACCVKVRTEKNTGTEVIRVDVPVGELVTGKENKGSQEYNLRKGRRLLSVEYNGR